MVFMVHMKESDEVTGIVYFKENALGVFLKNSREQGKTKRKNNR